MGLSRMELFNRLVLAVAYELQQGFPRLHRLKFESLSLLADVDTDTRKACDDIFVETVFWLRDEGFLRYGSATLDGSFIMVSLTEKGTTRLLNELPHGVEGASTAVGEALKEVRNTGLSKVTEVVIAGIVRGFFGDSSG